MPGRTGRSGHLGESPDGRMHNVEKTLNSEYEKLFSVYLKAVTSKLWIYQTFLAFSNISTPPIYAFRIHGPVYSNCARTKKI